MNASFESVTKEYSNALWADIKANPHGLQPKPNEPERVKTRERLDRARNAMREHLSAKRALGVYDVSEMR